MTTAPTDAQINPDTITPAGKKAVRGAFLGWFVDMFDVYLPVIVLAPALAYFFSPDISDSQKAIFVGMIFATTLLGRPLGAFIFGHFGDRIGRKKTTVVAVSGFGVVTLLMAMMPGYEQLGTTAVWIFIFLRFIDGIFLGGEYTTANPLAMEHSPRARRGLYSGLIQSGFPLAFVAISLITLVTLQIFPAGDLDSPYVQYGWRLPFVLGAVLAFALAIYYHRSVEESPVWKAPAKGVSAPGLSLFRGANLKAFAQVFVLMTGFWFMTNAVNAVMPGLLKTEVGLNSSQVTVTLIGVFLILAAGFVAAGIISQAIGRRRFFIISGAACSTLGTLCYYLLINANSDQPITVFLLATATALLIVAPIGTIVAYLTERFRTGVRSSGYGLGYSLAVIIPSFFAFYQVWLGALLPAEYTILVLVVLGGGLLALGAALGPETRDVTFTDEDST